MYYEQYISKRLHVSEKSDLVCENQTNVIVCDLLFLYKKTSFVKNMKIDFFIFNIKLL